MRFIITMKDIKKYEILQQLINKKIKRKKGVIYKSKEILDIFEVKFNIFT